MEVFLDFESFSYANLPDVGVFRYCEHPTTEPLCYAITVDDAPVSLAIPNEDGLAFPRDFPEDAIFVAHNIEFERNLLKQKYEIDIPLHRWRDTAAMAARMSLPRSLEDLAVFFDLDVAAKIDSNTAKKGDSVCRPRPPSKYNPATRWTPATKPEAFTALYARCVLDVELCRAMYRRLLQLEENEFKIWQLTLQMNERGVRVDLDSLPAARRVLEREGEPLLAEFDLLTGGIPLKSPVKLAELLGMDDMTKASVRKTLRNENVHPKKHRILEIIQALSKSSVSKLDAMHARAHADRRVRGSFLYAGAERTLRWSSSGVQFQNFKRGLGHETEIAFAALHTDGLEAIFDGAIRPPPDPPLTPTATIAEMLRGFILGPFLVGDFAQIEARGIAWLADDQEQLTLFREKRDPYCAMASSIYGVPVTKKDTARRFMGKFAELSCGYGIGSNKFAWMLDEAHDVQITDEFALQVVTAYRTRHPKIESFWSRLEKALVHVVVTKKERVRVTRNLWMGWSVIGGKNYAWIELPNGRKMYYADPELEPGKYGPQVSFFGRDRFTKGWARIRAYGGMLAGHVTQAFAREIIAAALLRLDAAGYKLQMTVHDEAVAEQDGMKDLKDFAARMKECPPWAEGMPIEVDVFETFRYRK
jgi:DNA polymerase